MDRLSAEERHVIYSKLTIIKVYIKVSHLIFGQIDEIFLRWRKHINFPLLFELGLYKKYLKKSKKQEAELRESGDYTESEEHFAPVLRKDYFMIPYHYLYLLPEESHKQCWSSFCITNIAFSCGHIPWSPNVERLVEICTNHIYKKWYSKPPLRKGDENKCSNHTKSKFAWNQSSAYC